MNKETRVPDWMLERYLLDELPRRERRRLEKRLEQDPELRAGLEALRLADQKALRTYPPERMIPEILRRAALARPRTEPRRRWRLAWAAAPALALAAILLLVVPPLLRQRLDLAGTRGADDYLGIKGDGASIRAPRLLVYRQGLGGGERIQDGGQARAGDRLQVAFMAGGQTHGVILSIDGAGVVTLHFPDRLEGDTALPPGAKIFLPSAYELDEAPGFERFFFVSAKEKLPTAAIMEKARSLAGDPDRAMTGSLELAASASQFSLLIRK